MAPARLPAAPPAGALPGNDSGDRAAPTPPAVSALGFHWGALLGGPLWLMDYSVPAAYLPTVIGVAGWWTPWRWWAEAAAAGAWVALSVWAGRAGYALAWRRRRYAGGMAEFLATQRAESLRCVIGAGVAALLLIGYWIWRAHA